MNTRTKGRLLELRAEKELNLDGWITYRVKGTTRFNKNVDIFGEFDILAVKKGIHKYIQIKANQKPGLKDIVRLGKLHKKYFGVKTKFEWWTYWNRGKRKSKQGWEKIDLLG